MASGDSVLLGRIPIIAALLQDQDLVQGCGWLRSGPMNKIRCRRRPAYATVDHLLWNYPDLDDYFVDMVTTSYCNDSSTYMVL